MELYLVTRRGETRLGWMEMELGDALTTSAGCCRVSIAYVRGRGRVAGKCRSCRAA
jgi:hypothetical protein